MDLVQEGTLGLCLAALKYNPRLGVPFSCYASRWIKTYIHRARHESTDISLDAPVEPSGISLGDLIEDDGPSPCVLAAKAELKDRIRPYIDQLPDMEREVIRLVFGFTGREHTLQEIGMYYDLSRERIRQIKAKASRQLREAMKGCIDL